MVEPDLPPEVEISIPGSQEALSQPTFVSLEDPSSNSDNISASTSQNRRDSTINGADTKDEHTVLETSNDEEKKYIEMLSYIALSEEMRKNEKEKCFKKDYDGNLSEWTSNHFFQKRSKAEPKQGKGKNQKAKGRKKNANETKKSQTVKELQKTCKDRNLKFTTKMKKAELLDILKKHDGSMGETEDDNQNPASNDNAVDSEEDEPNDELAGNVIITSYEYASLLEKIPCPTADSKSGAVDDAPWMVIPCPIHWGEIPVVTENIEDSPIRQYLNYLRNLNPERFSDCNEDLNKMVPFLEAKDLLSLPGNDSCSTKVRDFIKQKLKDDMSWRMLKVYEELFEWQSRPGMEDSPELYLGFCHVRKVHSTTKNCSPYKKTIVNGPLFEVPVEAKLLKGVQGSMDRIIIRPKQDAEIAMNGEVFSAITSGGQCNAEMIDTLNNLAQTTSVSLLHPEHPDSIFPFLEAARLLSCGGNRRSAKDENVHRPPKDLQKLVITDAYCLSSRKKKSTPSSKDARHLIVAMKSRNLRICEPIRAILSGPACSKRFVCPSDMIKAENMVYCLSTSKAQVVAGERLLVQGESLIVLFGPPGTGKTHSIVNIAATSLSEEKSVVVASSNQRALRAFVDKLPEQMRKLVLDISSVEIDGVSQFQKSLEAMIYTLQKARTGRSDVELERVRAKITKKKGQLESTFTKMKTSTEVAQDLLDKDDLKKAIDLASDLSMKASWLVKAIITRKPTNLNAILMKAQDQKGSVSFKGIEGAYLEDEFLHLIEKKASEEARKDTGSFVFKFEETSSEEDQKLSRIQVNGGIPKSQTDWETVLNAFKFRKDCMKPLLGLGCKEDEIYDEGKASFRTEFIALLVAGCQLENAIEPLEENLKEGLENVFQTVAPSQIQDEYRRLTTEIQTLESKVVFLKAMISLNKRIGQDALKTLKVMNQKLKNMSSAALASGNNMTERSSRHFREFVEEFKKAAQFMPFLVMNMDQVNMYLPPTHSCDIGIMDESSQSSCTAITFMARCKQMLVVGDDKQVSPSHAFLSEERVRALKNILPQVSAKNQFLPESSFFDLCYIAFPSSEVRLEEHYRCDPGIITISNEIFYDDALIPLRLSGKSSALEDMPIEDGTRDQKKKVNMAEAQAIATRICGEIQRTANERRFQTIGVVSMGGADQCKLIKKLVDEGLVELINEYGPRVVDRHNILYGTSTDVQGDERDIIFLSTVYSTAKAGQKLKQDDNWKAWNVALTRSKNKMVLCRSFHIKDLKQTDIRSRIFRYFLDAGKPNNNDDVSPMMLESDGFLVAKVENALWGALKKQGYRVKKKEGGGKDYWVGALCVESEATNSCSLLLIENSGESEGEWEELFDQQLSLERAGRSCLRVSLVSLALNFDATLDDILSFLKKSELPGLGKRGARTTPSNDESKKPKTLTEE